MEANVKSQSITENQLIRLAIKNLTIEDFDSELIKSVKVMVYISEKPECIEYPFLLPNLSLKHLLSKEIDLEFSYKNRQFAKAAVRFSQDIPPCLKFFNIQSTFPLELSPEKQRPRKSSTSSDLKSIGKGSIEIQLENSLSQQNLDLSDCNDIALGLENLLRDQGILPEKQIENLRVVIIGLNSKLKTLCLTQQQLTKSEEISSQHLVLRENLQFSIDATCESMSQSQKSMAQAMEDLINQRAQTENKYQELMKQFREKCIVENELESRVKFLENEVEKLKNQLKNFADMEKFIENLRRQIKSLEVERDVFRNDFRKTIKNYECDISSKMQEIEARDKLITNLNNELEDKKGQIHVLNSNIEDKDRIALLHLSEISELNSKLKCLKDLEFKSLQFEDLSKKHQSECTFLQQKLTKCGEDFSLTISSLHIEKNTLSSNLQGSFQEHSKTKQELQDKTALYRAELVTSQDLRTKSAIIHQKLSNAVDGTKMFSQIKYLSQYASEVKDKMVEDIDAIVMLFIKTAEDHMSAIRIIDEIKEVVEDRDSEISILRELIAELQNKTIYCPVKDDPVDEAIADYINSRTEPMLVHFIREDYGMYLFGTKRVFMKLENGRIASKGLFSTCWWRVYEN